MRSSLTATIQRLLPSHTPHLVKPLLLPLISSPHLFSSPTASVHPCIITSAITKLTRQHAHLASTASKGTRFSIILRSTSVNDQEITEIMYDRQQKVVGRQVWNVGEKETVVDQEIYLGDVLANIILELEDANESHQNADGITASAIMDEEKIETLIPAQSTINSIESQIDSLCAPPTVLLKGSDIVNAIDFPGEKVEAELIKSKNVKRKVTAAKRIPRLFVMKAVPKSLVTVKRKKQDDRTDVKRYNW